jgi:hypothetical protein
VVSEKDADLAVLNPTGRTTVLSGYAGRFRTLLEKPSLIDDQHAIRITKVLDDVAAEVVAYGIGIPASTPKEALEAMWSLVANGLGDLPGVFPFDASEQAPEIGLGAEAKILAAKPC